MYASPGLNELINSQKPRAKCSWVCNQTAATPAKYEHDLQQISSYSRIFKTEKKIMIWGNWFSNPLPWTYPNNRYYNFIKRMWHEHHGVWNHQQLEYIILFRQRITYQSFALLSLCEGSLPETGGFPSQRASNVDSVSMLWGHHVCGGKHWLVSAGNTKRTDHRKLAWVCL